MAFLRHSEIQHPSYCKIAVNGSNQTIGHIFGILTRKSPLEPSTASNFHLEAKESITKQHNPTLFQCQSPRPLNQANLFPIHPTHQLLMEINAAWGYLSASQLWQFTLFRYTLKIILLNHDDSKSHQAGRVGGTWRVLFDAFTPLAIYWQWGIMWYTQKFT